MDPRVVTPDECILNNIFSEQHRPTNTSVFLQNWQKCIFKAEFPDGLPPRVVRLEAADAEACPFTMVAAMQEIAATRIADLVPKILQVGTVANAKGRQFQFCVMELAEGDTLNNVWDDMNDLDRTSVVTAVVDAMEQLHAVRLSDDSTQSILRQTLGDQEDREAVLRASFGGPSTGFLDDGPTLLAIILKRLKLKNPFCSIESATNPDGIVVRSIFDDLGSITVKDSDMARWPKEAVFCHNDLNAHNIMIQSFVDPDGNRRHRLGAIIDWELAGFYPSSYQLGLQDTYLSTANRHLSFYTLLKQHMGALTPSSPSQIVLLQAAELMFESRCRYLAEGRNIGALIRKRFIEMLRLSRSTDPYVGWIRDEKEGPAPKFTGADAEKLENDVIDEVIGSRSA